MHDYLVHVKRDMGAHVLKHLRRMTLVFACLRCDQYTVANIQNLHVLTYHRSEQRLPFASLLRNDVGLFSEEAGEVVFSLLARSAAWGRCAQCSLSMPRQKASPRTTQPEPVSCNMIPRSSHSRSTSWESFVRSKMGRFPIMLLPRHSKEVHASRVAGRAQFLAASSSSPESSLVKYGTR